MPKRINPAISEAESQVMGLLWREAPQGSEELVAALQPETAWHENTVRTLLNRLVRKGAVRAEQVVSDFIGMEGLPVAYGKMKRGEILKPMVVWSELKGDSDV